MSADKGRTPEHERTLEQHLRSIDDGSGLVSIFDVLRIIEEWPQSVRTAERLIPHRVAPVCDEHSDKGGGARSGCPYCVIVKLYAALSRLDYLCGEPNEMEVSGFDVFCNEDAVVENVKRALSARVAATDIDAVLATVRKYAIPGHSVVMPIIYSILKEIDAMRSAPVATEHRPDRDAIIEECALLCECFQIHYSQLGYSENERTSWVLAREIRAMKTGGHRAPKEGEAAVVVEHGRATEEMADAVRGVLQIIRNKPGATFKDVRRHCELRGDSIVDWPEWVLNAEGYVTEQGAAMMLYEIMARHVRSAGEDRRG